MNGFEAMAEATKDDTLIIKRVGSDHTYTLATMYAVIIFTELLKDQFEVIKPETNLDKAVEDVYHYLCDHFTVEYDCKPSLRALLKKHTRIN